MIGQCVSREIKMEKWANYFIEELDTTSKVIIGVVVILIVLWPKLYQAWREIRIARSGVRALQVTKLRKEIEKLECEIEILRKNAGLGPAPKAATDTTPSEADKKLWGAHTRISAWAWKHRKSAYLIHSLTCTPAYLVGSLLVVMGTAEFFGMIEHWGAVEAKHHAVDSVKFFAIAFLLLVLGYIFDTQLRPPRDGYSYIS